MICSRSADDPVGVAPPMLARPRACVCACLYSVPKASRRLLPNCGVVKMSEPAAKRAPSHSESYRGLFQSVFPTLVKELTEEGLKNPEISDGIQHLKEVR